MTAKYKFITLPYKSNCFVEAIKAKIKNHNVKIYCCKPKITRNEGFQTIHFMWDDGKNSYDFSDGGHSALPLYKCFWFSGRMRRFKKGFAAEYAKYRNLSLHDKKRLTKGNKKVIEILQGKEDKDNEDIRD